ncbi:MAG: hypothetical protein KUG78_04215 [Kangiellaceae bacterium]|nr:hypothetical protein [Kangiellaceae bacterium]
MKIASVQLDIQWLDKVANLKKAKKYVEKAALEGCYLIVFPEMFATGYSMDINAVSELSDGETMMQLSQLAKKNSIGVIAGLVQTNHQGAENTAVYIDNNGELQARYIKNYPFTLAGESEKYVTGNQQVLFDVNGATASLFICYDLRFPELFRKVAKDVDMIFIIASWPITRQFHWELLLQARAVENQCFVIGVNRIGNDGNQLEYGGGSLIFNPMGELVSKCPNDKEYITSIIEPNLSRQTRSSFPFLDDIKLS